ncbi:MAG: amidohydrolase, partial [Acidimicrobiia bacterium]|nr:amidohydrolase [Acidimicrobiia bacterium]
MPATSQDRVAITNAQIVTVDKSSSVIENGSLVVGGDGSIRAISSSPIANDAPETIDANGAIVMPGL